MDIDTDTVIALTKEFLDHLEIEVDDVSYVADALHPIISIKSGDAKKLIGNRGETLKALNYLIKRAVERRMQVDHPNFLIDVNHYQQDRNEEVRRKAKIIIERVRSFKSSAQLDPLNAYERMLVHSMVADDPEIETVSEGEGKVKQITVRYHEPEAGASESPEDARVL